MTGCRAALLLLIAAGAATARAQSSSRAVGVVAGVVMIDDSTPVADALVQVEGRPAIRTAHDGRFLVDSVAVGARRVAVRALGRSPETATLVVKANDTSRVVITLTRITTLDSVRVSANSFRTRLLSQYEQRRKAGWGTFRDSTTLAAKPSMTSVFADLPLPNIVVREQRGGAPLIYLPMTRRCLAIVWVDGLRVDQAELARFRPTDIAAIEVYAAPIYAPREYKDPADRCGSVVVWTKLFLPP
jgi:hypothetical protein